MGQSFDPVGSSTFGGRTQNGNANGAPPGIDPYNPDPYQPTRFPMSNSNQDYRNSVGQNYEVFADYDDSIHVDAEEIGRRNLNIFLCIFLFVSILGFCVFLFLKRHFVARDDQDSEEKPKVDTEEKSLSSVESKSEK